MAIPDNTILSIAVYCTDEACHDAALALAGSLAIPMTAEDTGAYDFLLTYTADGLALQQTGKNRPGPIMVNFLSSTIRYRLQHGGGRSQALARAIGLKKGINPKIIDATAGLGRDGFILAHLGCQVHMIERSPILAALLEDGLKRAAQDDQTAAIIKSRLLFSHSDSRDFLKKLPHEDYPDVIYLDPMFPERTKSSLVKKEMRLLRGLAGDDRDAGELLTIALKHAKKRVVVKRPRLAPALNKQKPTHSVTGKTSRFDVYLV